MTETNSPRILTGLTVREIGAKITRRECVNLFIAAGVSGLGSAAVPQSAFALDKIPVALTGTTLFFMGIYVAKDKGLFEQEGVDVDLFNAGAGGGQPAVNALVAGEAMCSTQDPVLCEAARQKGAKVRSIGAQVNRMAVYVVGKKDIPVQDLSGWKGRKMAILQRPNTGASIITYVLTKAGWKEEPKNTWIPPDGGEPFATIETRQGNQFPALLAGAVDMAAGFEPGASDAIFQDSNLHMVWSFPKSFGEFQFGTLCALNSDIEQRPKMMQAFMNGIAHSYKFLRTERAQVLDVGKKWFPQLNQTVLETAFDRFINEDVYPERTTISEKAWKANFDEFLPFVKYPLQLPVHMSDATYLEFAKNADKKFGLG